MRKFRGQRGLQGVNRGLCVKAMSYSKPLSSLSLVSLLAAFHSGISKLLMGGGH